MIVCLNGHVEHVLSRELNLFFLSFSPVQSALQRIPNSGWAFLCEQICRRHGSHDVPGWQVFPGIWPPVEGWRVKVAHGRRESHVGCAAWWGSGHHRRGGENDRRKDSSMDQTAEEDVRMSCPLLTSFVIMMTTNTCYCGFILWTGSWKCSFLASCWKSPTCCGMSSRRSTSPHFSKMKLKSLKWGLKVPHWLRWPSVCLSVCLLSVSRPSVCLPACLSVCLPAWLSACLFVCLTDQFTCLQVYQKSAVSVSDSSEELITGGGASTFSDPPPRLTINRPFIFIIYHQMSGSVLLVGRVSNPTSQ